MQERTKVQSVVSLPSLAPFFLVLLTAWFVGGGLASPVQDPELPTCDAGPSQTVECSGPKTRVRLDGGGSTNPIPGALSYSWTCDNPLVVIRKPNSISPTAIVTMRSCVVVCTVQLTVTNQIGSSTCTTTIRVEDTTPPVIECPPDITLPLGESTAPDATGRAVAADVCDRHPRIGFFDDTSITNTILRTWAASDGCNTSTCVQVITIIGPVTPHFDVKPGACPNFVDVQGSNSPQSEGSVKTSLLGNGLNVGQVDLTTLRMGRQSSTDTSEFVEPVFTALADSGTPFMGEDCECHELTDDGTLDVDVVFDLDQMVEALRLADEPDGTEVIVEIRGKLLTGQSFSATDCITVVNP